MLGYLGGYQSSSSTDVDSGPADGDCDVMMTMVGGGWLLGRYDSD